MRMSQDTSPLNGNDTWNADASTNSPALDGSTGTSVSTTSVQDRLHLASTLQEGQERIDATNVSVLEKCRLGLSALLEIVFPERCPVCQKTLDGIDRFGLCTFCTSKIVYNGPCCARCSAPIPESAGQMEDCTHCRDESWAFRRAMSLGVYDGALRDSVILMKRPYFDSLSLQMGLQLAEKLLTNHVEDWDWIVPTPQHWWRRISKRTNSSELLAESIGKRLGIRVQRHCLRRTRIRKKQGLLGLTQRRQNVRGIFRISPWIRPKNKRILLVDDILTSGATASEMAKALLQAGATSVDVAVVARALK